MVVVVELDHLATRMVSWVPGHDKVAEAYLGRDAFKLPGWA